MENNILLTREQKLNRSMAYKRKTIEHFNIDKVAYAKAYEGYNALYGEISCTVTLANGKKVREVL
jgi:hypothetical protein